MRGTIPAQSRLSAARAFLAGAAILAGAATQAIASQPPLEGAGDTALAVPRLSPTGGGGVALPRPLPSAAARLLREAFRDPAAPLDGLQDSLLLGDVLAVRYLASRPEADELRAWLRRYGEQADAPAIHALLLTRLSRGEVAPDAPVLPAFAAPPPGDDIDTGGQTMPRNPALDRSVRDAVRAGQFERAMRLVAGTRGLGAGYGALLRAEIAQAMFGQGRDVEALRLAEAADRLAHGTVGLAPWVGGLAAWRLGRPELARTWFEAAYRAPMISPGRRAGAAFWAARASLVTRGDHGPWMQRAAHDPRTFYGLLARRVLGQSIQAAASAEETLGEADVEALLGTRRGERAFALLQVGQATRAAAEFRLLWSETRDRPGFGRSVLVVARAAGLAELAGQLEAAMQPTTVRLPATRLRPAGGFRLDPALVYAMARLESNFDASAVSPAGARGLMQLMPVTAGFVKAGGAGSLHDPAVNLDLAQRYMLQLTQLEAIGPDLIRVLASYNAGPGSFARWMETMRREDDPLLFIEALPLAETRSYVPRALAYTWLYAAQLGVPSSSLDELAAGLWPTVQVRAARRVPAVRLH